LRNSYHGVPSESVIRISRDWREYGEESQLSPLLSRVAESPQPFPNPVFFLGRVACLLSSRVRKKLFQNKGHVLISRLERALTGSYVLQNPFIQGSRDFDLRKISRHCVLPQRRGDRSTALIIYLCSPRQWAPLAYYRRRDASQLYSIQLRHSENSWGKAYSRTDEARWRKTCDRSSISTRRSCAYVSALPCLRISRPFRLSLIRGPLIPQVSDSDSESTHSTIFP